jgi:hypothetical protein
MRDDQEGHPLRLKRGFGSGTAPIWVNAAHGYEPTREAAMAAFAKSWRRS